ncbi:MAG: SDR family oxidoreductase [bacterium]
MTEPTPTTATATATATTLVVGASRGIGLEICRQLRQRGDRIIAACRTPNDDLERLGANVIGGIDVTCAQSVRELAEQLRSSRLELDWLIHNAGVLARDSLDDLDFERMTQQYQVNALGPLRLAQALLPSLRAGSKIGILTSRVGSLGDNTSGGLYGYRMSKAAANMAGVNLAHDLRERGIAVFMLHPGLVATEMTDRRGIAPSAAAQGIIARMQQLSLGDSGTFWHAEGHPLPW